MKKILTLLFIHITFLSFSQISFGVKGGLTLNNLSVHSNIVEQGFLYDTDPLTGFHVGAWVGIPLKGKFSLIPELQFANRGFSLRDAAQQDKTTNVNWNYLEMPVLFSYAPVKWLGIDLGPNVGYVVSVAARTEGSKSNLDQFFYDKKFDFGANAGIRIYVSEKMAIVGRYYVGISKVHEMKYRDVNNVYSGYERGYHRSGQFGISYKFR